MTKEKCMKTPKETEERREGGREGKEDYGRREERIHDGGEKG